MKKTNCFVALALSLISLNLYAHGNISFPKCLLGGDLFIHSAYTCKIEFRDPQPSDNDYTGDLKTFKLEDIFSKKISSWKGDELSATYITSGGTQISLTAMVSCPIQNQEVDPRVIDILLHVYLEDSVDQDTELWSTSALPGREMRTTFIIDNKCAEIVCAQK